MNLSVRELHSRIIRDYDDSVGMQFLSEVGGAESVSFNAAMDALDRALAFGSGPSVPGLTRTAGFGRIMSREMKIQIPPDVAAAAAERFQA